MTSEGPQLQMVRSADGTPIACFRSGDGPAVVLVHGALITHRGWSGLETHLRDRFALYSYDRRGRGESGDSPSYAVQREVEDLAAVLALTGGAATVFGHSSGAVLALQAAEQGLPVDRLVLYEPPLVVPGGRVAVPEGLPQRLQALVAAGDRSAAVLLFLREGGRWPEADIEALLAPPGRREALDALAATAAYDCRIVAGYAFEPARLAGLQQPALLLVGEQSPEWTRVGTAALAAALPRSRVALLPEQGHHALLTVPGLVATMVAGFLAGED